MILLMMALLTAAALVVGGCSEENASPASPDACTGGDVNIDGTDIRVRGFIEDKGDSTLVVYCRDIDILPATLIKGDGDTIIPFYDLVVGMRVEVYGTIAPDERIQAEEIEVDTRDDSQTQ